jgi:hypothetical protein
MNLPNLLAFLLLLSLPITGAAQQSARRPAPTPAIPGTIQADLDVTYGHTPEQELKMDIYRPKAGGENLPACSSTAAAG